VRPDSDVDLLVESLRLVGLFEFSDMTGYLETLLGCRVDLGVLVWLEPQLREPILREAVYLPWRLANPPAGYHRTP
jgi:uncharacterized protein